MPSRPILQACRKMMAPSSFVCSLRTMPNDESLVIYRGKDGDLWARPVREFRDGRFEPVGKAR
jgi:hypothetical protein